MLLTDLRNPLLDLLLRGCHPLWRHVPVDYRIDLEEVNEPVHHISAAHTTDSVCSVPLSIAFNNGISIDFFSCGY